MEYLLAALQALTIFTILVIGYFFKNYLPSYFTEKGKNLATKEDIGAITNEAEKARLIYSSELEGTKKALQEELEALKHQLMLIAQERQIRFAKLHEKRAEVVAELYYLIEDTNISIRLFSRVLKLRGEDRASDETVNRWSNKTEEKAEKLFYFARRHKLYFSKELAQMIEQLVFRMQTPSQMFAISQIQARDLNQGITEYSLEIVEHWEKEESHVSSTMKLIETEFRQILGSEL